MRLLPALLLLSLPAAAQDPPNCVPAREGMVACFGEKLCECRWSPGGSVVGRPPGHRWDCGALRPACGTAPAGPPAAEPPPQVSVMPLLPSRFAIPRSGGAAAPHETR
ncbi:MAG: hypothetical protein ACOYOH_27425 [Paracraurococcus sp.]|jgi:hypothetical protein